MIDSVTIARENAREVKFARCDLKAVEPDGTFAGYASLFNREDLGQDIVAPGAFQSSLAARKAQGIKLLFQHDPAEPIGIWTDVHEDAKGLYAKGRLMPEVARAREVLSLMRAGAVDGLSIGFRAVKGRRDAATGVRRLEQIDLWEISVVTFPMQPEARVETVKARAMGSGLPTEREFERWLTRDAGLTRGEARVVIAQGFKRLAGMRDAAGSDQEARLAAVIRQAAARINAMMPTL